MDLFTAPATGDQFQDNEEKFGSCVWGNYPDMNRACTKWLRSRGLMYETNPHVVLRGWKTMGDLRKEGGE